MCSSKSIYAALKNFAQLKKLPTFSMKTKVIKGVNAANLANIVKVDDVIYKQLLKCIIMYFCEWQKHLRNMKMD